MKYKVVLLSCLCLMLSAIVFAQEKNVSIFKTVETNRFKNNPTLGGDVVLYTSTKEIIGDRSYITFEMDVPQAGNYFLNAWIMPSQKPDNSFTAYDLQLNGSDIAAKLQAENAGWQTLALPGTLRLKAGKNTVSISTQVPEIPNIEFIRLSTSSEKASISSAKYDQFASQAASSHLQSKSSIQSMGYVLDNTPFAAYRCYRNVDLRYTAYTDFVFTRGSGSF